MTRFLPLLVGVVCVLVGFFAREQYSMLTSHTICPPCDCGVENTPISQHANDYKPSALKIPSYVPNKCYGQPEMSSKFFELEMSTGKKWQSFPAGQQPFHYEQMSTISDWTYLVRGGFHKNNHQPGGIVYVDKHLLEEFCLQVAPKLTQPFVMITGRGDAPSPKFMEQLSKNLHFRGLFGYNCYGWDPRFMCYPLGVSPHTKWTAGIVGKPPAERDITIYVAFSKFHKMYMKEVNALRQTLWRNACTRNGVWKKLSVCETNPGSPKAYHEKMARSKFVFSPLGAGRDAFRTWEALALGAYPIVLPECSMEQVYKDLPVLVVERFEDVTEEMLSQKYAEFEEKRKRGEYKWELLTLEYWKQATRKALTWDPADAKKTVTLSPSPAPAPASSPSPSSQSCETQMSRDELVDRIVARGWNRKLFGGSCLKLELKMMCEPGLGHRMMGIALGLIYANSTGGSFHLPDIYFTVNSAHLKGRKGYDGTEEMLGLSGLFPNEAEQKECEKVAPTVARIPNFVPTPAVLDAKLKANPNLCGTFQIYGIGPTWCPADWCSKKLSGVFKHVRSLFEEVYLARLACKAPKGKGPLRVKWHVRNGDDHYFNSPVYLKIRQELLEILKGMNAEAEHVVFSYLPLCPGGRYCKFQQAFTEAKFDFGAEKFNDHMSGMIHADILVCSGSNLCESANLLASPDQAILALPSHELVRTGVYTNRFFDRGDYITVDRTGHIGNPQALKEKIRLLRDKRKKQ